mgnify:FL=1
MLYINIIQAMQVVLEGLATLGCQLQPENQEFATFIESLDAYPKAKDLRDAVVDPKVPVAIAALWTDAAVTDVVCEWRRQIG